MGIVSEYAARTPAEEAFAGMLAAYDRSLPDIESLYDPARCPPAFLPYLAQSYYADTYSPALGDAYNRMAIATGGRIAQMRGCWGAARQVARNANVILFDADYRRGPGSVWNAKLTASGAGRIGNVQYGSLYPRGVKLPGGADIVAIRLDAGNSISLIADAPLDAADWPSGELAFQAPGYEGAVIVLTSAPADGIGRLTISGSTATIAMRGVAMGRLRTAAGIGADVQFQIRPGKMVGNPGAWAARRDAWTFDAPLRNTSVHIRVGPKEGVAATDYTQAMAHVLDRILPYEINANDVQLEHPLTLSVAPVVVPGDKMIAYTGYH